MPNASTMNAPSSSWMTLLQASAALGVHINTVRRWVDAGAIASYRTLGGHRRLSEVDVRALADASADVGETTPGPAVLDEHTVSLIEATLAGELSTRECRLRLRALGQEHGRIAAEAGIGIAALLADHASTRRGIVALAGRAGRGAGEDGRGWANGLADALLMGLSEGIDLIPERTRSVRAWRAK